MQNELARIGAIIYDLRVNRNPDLGQENFDFLDEEFLRITGQLAAHWYEQVPGLAYLLDFHREETLRLSALVEGLTVDNVMKHKGDFFMENLYHDLNTQLVELLRRIDLMAMRKFDFNIN